MAGITTNPYHEHKQKTNQPEFISQRRIIGTHKSV
jgi:hypothetical protein